MSVYSGNNDVSGFIQADGKKIINGDGKEIVLRGVGFGSWLLPEGYMWKFPEGGDRPRKIEAMVEALIGKEKASRFWDTYVERYVDEIDVREVAKQGYNSVRLPINARGILEAGDEVVFNEKRLARIHQVIEWCRAYKLYVILDLHGAPGGQTGANIDDSENDQPELFIDRKNQELTIAIWRMFAERYKDDWIIAGYDLFNEPLPDWFSQYNGQVEPLYKEITAAIRAVDKRHMIIIEGVHWSTDWSIFTDKFDHNLMLQFHKYWNNPDSESIQKYLDKREEWNVPIFMGEGGENNAQWYSGAFQMFEDHEISWNFWTWKKMSTLNSPYSIRMPEGWHLLTSYLEGGAKPDAETAEKILNQYLDNLKLENCDAYPEISRSLLRHLPLQIPAEFYGQGEGKGFGIVRKRENKLELRASDGVPMRMITGKAEKPSYHSEGGKPWAEDNTLCVELYAGDWLAYDALCVEARKFDLRARLHAAEGGAVLSIEWEGHEQVTRAVSGEEWQESLIMESVDTAKGAVRVIIRVLQGQVDLDWVTFSYAE
ncbi:cellulase family glycosylhydrolase [Paenibacillus sp. PL91]|uniref:cellulase family glycosylhydrolase n=1 Tax=Paenibacillus sp. PL91 TaxID=2729538 RepID=UPI00145E9FD6|nr:cellulase family glycosylhydrolase [Paenibacillus sp. PL91]MBC9201407.1 cellulase family glycosylhydrolase [Paenibacillus sp. PL91]